MGKAELKVKYHGLLNQGATCYLNSVLQVLFMTEDFRETVIRSVDEKDNAKFIDPQLKVLFHKLLKKTTGTDDIKKALGINKVCEQRDAAEYIERILRQTSPDAAKIFHGQMAHRTTCSVCETEDDRDGPFWHLPLELVDSSSGNYSVEEGIKRFFTASDFSGDNQMYCDHCDTKVDATSRYVIKHHPDVLILLLKRFDFSYKFMSYIKINCSADVPCTLKIPEKQTYELYAVVDHSGDLRSGHYSATIKPQDEDSWYSFDDRRVSQLKESPFLDNENTVRSDQAYLLFYKKKGDCEPADADKEEMNTNLNTKRNRNDEAEEADCREESLQEKPQKRGRFSRRNSQKSQRGEEEENTDGDEDHDFNKNKLDDQNRESRKAVKSEPHRDDDALEEGRSDTKQTVRDQRETLEDPDDSHQQSASETRRQSRSQRAEREEEKKKETPQEKTSRDSQRAAEREQGLKQTRRSLKGKRKLQKVKINKKGRNKIAAADLPKNVALDHNEPVMSKQQTHRKRSSEKHQTKNKNNQSDVPVLKPFTGVELQTPGKNTLRKERSPWSCLFGCVSPINQDSD